MGLALPKWNITREKMNLQSRKSTAEPDSRLDAPGTSPFWGTLLYLLMREAQCRANYAGEHFSLHLFRDVCDLDASLLDNQAPTGAVCIGVPGEVVDRLAADGIPVAGYAGYAPIQVSYSRDALIASGVSALARSGRRRIALLNGSLPTLALNAAMREPEAFRAALAHNELLCRPELVHDFSVAPPEGSGDAAMTLQEQGMRAASLLFDGNVAPPDGILSTDDMVTDGLLTGLSRLGIKVGIDVEIATHVNAGSPILASALKSLIALVCDPAEIVSELFRALEDTPAASSLRRSALLKARVVMPVGAGQVLFAGGRRGG
jgi:DNA-binding LacI/PurR family transcriptional regulator